MKRACFILIVALFIYVGDIIAQNVEFIGQCDTPGSASDVFVQGDFAYIADRDSGLQIVKVSYPQVPSIVGRYNLPGTSRKLFIQGYFAYVAVDNYGLQIINISNPRRPVWVGSYEDCRNAWDVYVSGYYAYVCGDVPDLAIIDVSDPRNAFLAGSYSHGHTMRGIHILNDFAYMVDFYSGLYIIDIVDPENPFLVARCGTGGQTNYDIFINGDYSYIANDVHGVQIIDVSDPYQPFWASEFDTPGRSKGVFVQDDYGYEADGDSGLYIFDIVSPIYPVLAGRYDTPGSASNVFAVDDYVYLANGNEGLFILRFLGPMLGSIEGIVMDAETGEPLEGVLVDAISTRFCDTSNADGEYFLDSLYNFSYDIFFRRHDYFDTVISDVQVVADDTTILDVSMQHRPEADVGVSAIISPKEFISTNSWLKSELTNYGTAPQDFDVIFEVYVSGSPDACLSDTVTVMSMPGVSVDTVLFTKILVPLPDTNYNIISYTYLASDQNSDNDTTVKACYTHPAAIVWFGNVDGSPITALIGDRVYIDAYIQTPGNIYIGFLHICHGGLDQYVDSLFGYIEGEFYYPLYDWDFCYFLEPEGSPPNPEGWSSESFMAWMNGGEPGTPLHADSATKILTYVIKSVGDSLLAGDTVGCLGPGIHSISGESVAGDTMGLIEYTIIEHFSPLYFTFPPGSCEYMPGDINGDSSVMPGDVTYGVRYFEGLGEPPPDSCFNDSAASWLYAAGDVNGNCWFRGSDITFLVAYFKGYNPEILWCHWTPPANPPLLRK